jgi:hypothetical protein
MRVQVLKEETGQLRRALRRRRRRRKGRLALLRCRRNRMRVWRVLI